MRKKPNTQNQHGQSMIETALLFPLMLLLFAGMIEIVFISRTYLVMLDSSYQGAHLGSQGKVLFDDLEIKTLVLQDLSPGYNNTNLKDIIITRAIWDGTTLTTESTYHYGTPAQLSIFTKDPSLLPTRLAGRPATRLIAVEVLYDHPLLFDFSFTRGLIPNPFPLEAYTIQYVARD
jgi:Flp pilus assembly protein TadG